VDGGFSLQAVVPPPKEAAPPEAWHHRFVPRFIFVLAATGVLATGIVGMGRTGTCFSDFQIVYAAGPTLLKRCNPYDQKELAPRLQEVNPQADLTAPYSYPPHFSSLIAILGLAPYPLARIVWLFLLVGAVGLSTVIACTFVVPVAAPGTAARSERWWFASLALGNPMVSNDLWLGQPAILAYLGLLLAWYGMDQKKWILSGLGLGLALIKPQLGLFILVWLIFSRAYAALAVGAGLISLLSIYPALVLGPIHLVTSWRTRLSSYVEIGVNAPGSEHSIGLRSLLVSAGLPAPGLEILGVILVGGLWWYRAKLTSLDRLGLLLALTLIFVFNMDSAYICLIPLVGALWVRARQDRIVLWATVGLLLAFGFPRRVMRMSELPILNHWRTLVVMALAALLIAGVRRAAGLGRSSPAGA